MKRYFGGFLLSLFFFSLHAQQKGDEIILKAMEDELNRSKELCLPGQEKPFFIAYYFVKGKQTEIKANLGNIVSCQETPESSFAMVKLLLGNNAETSQIRFGGGVPGTFMPLDSDYNEIRRRFWLMTDQAYKKATFNLADKQAHTKQAMKKERELDDWISMAPLTRYVDQEKPYHLDQATWKEKLRQFSAILKEYPQLEYSEIILSTVVYDVYMKNSEGTTLKFPICSILLRGRLGVLDKAENMQLESVHWTAKSLEELPSTEIIENAIRKACDEMVNLKNGSQAGESYSGPVLLEGEIVPYTFFRFSGLLIPIREDNEIHFVGKNNFKKVGDKIIDDRISMVNYTKMKEYNGISLLGAYEFDAEGVVPVDKIVLVDKGIKKSSLNDRIPKIGAPTSTGSAVMNFSGGVFDFSIAPGVLHVLSSKTESASKLKKELLKTAQKEGLSYAYIIRSYFAREFVYKVDVKTGEETLVTDMPVPLLRIDDFRHLLGVSNEEVVRHPDFMMRGHTVSVIAPNAVLLEKLTLRTREMTDDDHQNIKFPLQRMSKK